MLFNLQRFAAEWADPVVATLKVNVDTKADGNIALDGDTVAGTKTLTMNGFKANGTLDNANTVFEKVLGDIAGANFDLDTAQKITTQGVTE